ncbi:uncharacterized protein LOC115633784 [Scaptodrosophila lebanonensis]|uniref:Uncharacterized protein LOC115633784 n=1 Tax=Drosophila lebanonensis TaxID=7225 RepID=A0A6J2UI11_DROLE|nr:uncharacterized protein LOC115633784 [Scaptodrosophila lebanonensis]
MFKFICLLAFATGTYAASIGADVKATTERQIVELLRYEVDKQPDGSYHYSYEGADKSFREETGVANNVGTDEEALEISGSYRYIDADGVLIEVHYTAGKNGFVPVGTNIPGEISAAAKAAAELPNVVDEQEYRRKARSQAEEPTVAESENVPAQVVVDKTEVSSDVKSIAEKSAESENVPVQVVVEKTEVSSDVKSVAEESHQAPVVPETTST